MVHSILILSEMLGLQVLNKAEICRAQKQKNFLAMPGIGTLRGITCENFLEVKGLIQNEAANANFPPVYIRSHAEMAI